MKQQRKSSPKRVTLSVLLILTSLTACEQSVDPTSLDNRGEWTFINYWAKWCKPCIKEIPELNLLHAREGIRVLGVNYDGAVGDDLQAQLDSLNVRFPTLGADPAARFDVERPQVLPTTLVVDPRGALTTVLVGPQTEASLLAAAGITKAGEMNGEQDSGKE
ncbi:TlpA family protein disulfide reductase [Congregibacter sp.]|uniref:TlpA family protein disulfide reductase n=1 Tax=Congregibacter sp. TaxID=2744308 RepID=UPI003F6A8BF3